MRKLRFAPLLVVAAAALAGALATGASARPNLPEAGMAKKRSATPDVAGYDKQHGPHYDFECTATSQGANTRLDCDDPFPNNEPDIEVNPANPLNMIASSNDYGSCCDQYYTTLDGGLTWSTGNMSIEKPLKIGSDPVTVFDVKHGTAIHSSLSYQVQHAAGSQTCDGDLVVSHLERQRAQLAEARGRRRWDRLRLQQAPALQRQGVDRHRQQQRLAVLRSDVSDLEQVRVGQR